MAEMARPGSVIEAELTAVASFAQAIGALGSALLVAPLQNGSGTTRRQVDLHTQFTPDKTSCHASFTTA